MTHAPAWLGQIQFDDTGLVPVIAQDAASGNVLMFAWANAQALAETAATGRAVYWSRSRQKLWRKGEESGHVQQLHEIRLDCDGDVVLYKVTQQGGIACHTGRESCFYRRLDPAADQGQGHAGDAQWTIVDPVLKDPEHIYK